MPYKNPEDKKRYIKKWMQENKDKMNASQKRWREKNPDYVNEWYHKNMKDDHFSVYLLPNENYVGQTQCVRRRINEHKNVGNDTLDYKILHTFNTREEALEKEAEYHSKGYKGKHPISKN